MIPTTLTENYLHALEYALKVHDGQVRKGTTIPYFSHLIGVSSIVLSYGGTEEEALAALLHDAAEDCGGHERLDDIRKEFGVGVANIVEGCTDTFESPKPPWKTRKVEYLAHLEDVSASVLLVAAADKLHNLRSIMRDYNEIGDSVWDRFKASREETLWYYRELMQIFSDLGPEAIARELSLLLKRF